MTCAIRQPFILPFVILALSGCVSTLERSVESGDIEAVKQAIESGANVDGNYWTSIKLPVLRAIGNDDLIMVQLLHEAGANISPRYLGYAAQASATSTYEYLLANGAGLEVCTTDTNYSGFWGSNIENIMPPLGSAIARGNLSSVQKLLELGAPMEMRCDVPLGGDYNFSAILLAAYFGQHNIIRLLLRNGSNPNRLSVGGYTPLSLAAKYEHYDTARVLLADGAFHTYANEVKQPIEVAVDAGNEDVVNLLAYAGAVRPRRTSTSEVLQSIADTVIDGVIVIGTIALLVEGSKYYGYNSAYTSDVSPDISGEIVSNITSIGSSGTDDEGQCNSDFQCGVQEVCLKKPGNISGSCVQDASNTRLSGERDSVSSGFTRDLKPYKNNDCDEGGRWDLIYQACVE